jgi:pyrroline-5-carboxylate reductase
LRSTTIGFIGAGNMANGLIRGLIAKNTGPENIWASDPDESKLQLLAQAPRKLSLLVHTSKNTGFNSIDSLYIFNALEQLPFNAY